jgi:hypothetical protein
VPLERSSTLAAPLDATRLAELAAGVLDIDLDAGLRLTLEANTILAGASEAGTPDLRYRLATWGPVWAAMLERASRAAWSAGREALAADLGAWLAGVAGQLTPIASADPGVRRQARAAWMWLGELHVARRDEAGAAAARQVLDALPAD